MPRLPHPRPAADPATPQQQERADRILRAAARLGAEHGLDRVQMGQVARTAGVALGTLYRYYPTKHHLFAALLTARVAATVGAPGADPVAAVEDLVVGAATAMLRRPLLARAMITSVNAVRAESGASGDTTFRDQVLRAAGRDAPTEADRRLARLVEQCTYGVLTWAVAGETDADEAREDLRRAVRLLVAPDWSVR